ncbi:carbohydrate kinase family protein [Pedobacter sp. KBS0701]|uniref:carbohydrate kinase family protein n=1 Tax=Pedobacter sp. KBS0701 TaxID=2578106 RepID=UPI00110D7DC3|nr:carbohydrate kinase family protein [Pedobacter sp. KBS0701]QDW24838.1 carbohydrate kinase family protein [Pedobacter sp. KBS0701]
MNSTRGISAKKVLVVGELLVDMISDQNIESLAVSSQFSTNQGGSSANLCANLKWLGIDAELVATVGEDNLGSFLINELKTIGLSDKYIHRSANRQTSVILVAKNEHTPDFIPYRSADLAIKRVEDAAINSSDMIHTTAFALSKEPARTNILRAFTKAHESGKFLSVDWNFAPSIWQEDDGKDVFKKLMKMDPLLKISVDDLERFTGESLTIEEAVKWLDNLNAQIICLTCGKDGVWFKTKNQAWRHKPALPVNSVIGVTGAGDAFWSGFLSAFIHEKSIDECISQALEVAKLKIEKPYPLYKK